MGLVIQTVPNQATSDLPITDAIVEAWKTAAAVSVIRSPCPYEIKDDITIGPVKINCNLEISGSPTVTIAGPVWVVGNIEVDNSPTVKLASSLGANSVAVIADNHFQQNDQQQDEAKQQHSISKFRNREGSYILFVSQKQQRSRWRFGKSHNGGKQHIRRSFSLRRARERIHLETALA